MQLFCPFANHCQHHQVCAQHCRSSNVWSKSSACEPQIRTVQNLLRQHWLHDPIFAHHYWANSVESHCIQKLPSNTLLQINIIASMLLRVALFASDCLLQYCPTYVQHYWTLAHSPAYLNFNCRFTVLCQQLSSERYLPTTTLEEGEKRYGSQKFAQN